ncbi:urocortin 3, like [Latimeria chalumnae]|uniref:urocortin 3, like n=1 Tax=Latimeria chalumnae TaxID=7897 RepID=UPI0003C152B3|nr:PREDICTED: urocortin-3 [Latimeria chalumnae]|eukprot:XP_005997394.1 PREDICTED: urocortin-3 [Latimeria chalumnae]
MMLNTRLLLLLVILCTPRTNLSYRFYNSESSYSCIKAALMEAKKSNMADDNSVLDKRALVNYLPADEVDQPEEGQEEEVRGKEEDKEKRTFPASHYRYLTQAQLKGKMYQNSAKSNRRTKFTLSLDVPTNIMNILFNIAKAKNLRAKAAANARLMAQIGRRK